MTRPTFFRSVLPVLSAIVAGCLVAIAFLVWKFDPDPQGLAVDLIRAFTQIGIVAVAGAVINVVLKDREAMHARTNALNQFQKEILHRVNLALTGAKRQRRLLRAHALSEPYSGGPAQGILVIRAEYVEHMRAISDIELDLDALRYELDALPATFPERKPLRESVNTMKEYLRKLLRQYERVLPRNDGATFPLAALAIGEGDNPALTDFIGPKENSRFGAEFETPFREAVKLLRQALASTY